MAVAIRDWAPVTATEREEESRVCCRSHLMVHVARASGAGWPRVEREEGV